MAKRSTNFNSPRFRPQASDIVSLVNWLGMSDAEVQVVFRKAPFFVNLNGEETVEATITGGKVHYSVSGKQFTAGYNSSDIHPVDDGAGLSWYEINDTALTY